MKTGILLGILLLTLQAGWSQHLRRSGPLGLQPVPITSEERPAD